MSKTAVLVCSNAGLDYLEYPKDIEILRSVVQFGDESYQDFTEIDAKTFYNRLETDKESFPKTAYISYGKMIEIFEKLEKNGYTDAFIVTISTGLSGLNAALKKASEEVKLNVTVFDSKTVAYAQAYMTLKAYEMFKNNESLENVIKELEYIRDNNQVFFAVDTLLYLVKNGRLSKTSGTLGTLLKIKPILQITKDGKVESLEKIRTFHKALDRVIELYFEKTEGKDVITHISHGHNDPAVEYTIKKIKEKYPNREIFTSYLTPVVGAHTGPKAVGLGYIIKK
ncbi:DegV family protein [Alteracholeplasma palmae J233]|uniref:DegV family protein n=1 Tax=Alteracholeplasma palmae (strain ATCC 49389 / J233) TaxID=1318466 RepID=U4KLN4_ALTPJ|nr:DegV family protein [Alteracholeplasma palmae]CCV64797.1 DegV family protein [Alteracholeplasma palmae J233]